MIDAQGSLSIFPGYHALPDLTDQKTEGAGVTGQVM